MRNLKKLFAVLIAVAMIASLMVPALAAVSYTSEGLALQQIGLIAGGADELKLDDSMTRLQGLAFTIRAAGKEDDAFAMTDAEVDAILADWTDADDIPSWSGNGRKYAAYAIKEKITVGISSTEKILAPNDPISGASFLVFLMISGMGYEVDTNHDSDKYVIDAAIDAGILNASQAVIYRTKAELIRDDAAGILFGAVMNGVNADGTKLIDALIASGDVVEADAIAAGFIEGLTAVSVSAIGARKLEVSFNVAVDSEKATIEVKRGTVKPSVKSITWAEDKKSAVIEFNTDMAAGDYTVTVTGLAEEALTATTTVEAAKLALIRFTSEIAVLTKDKNSGAITGATASAVAENQYGEDMTSTLTTTTPPTRISISSSASGTISMNKGAITITDNTLKVDQKIVVTIVDSTTGTVATQTLTVANAAAVESIEFGELTTDNDDLKGKEINVTAMTTNADKYYLPITVKDQYGNVLNKAGLVGFNVMSSNENIVKLAADPIADTDNGTVIKFQTTGKEVSGTVVITAVATGTGKSANTTIVVKDNPKIDTVTLSAPESELKINIAAVLPLTIVNSYGEELSVQEAKPVLVDNNGDPVSASVKETNKLKLSNDTTLTATNAMFSIVKDWVKDTTTIKVKPTDKNVIITVTTATGKYQSLSLVANDAPVPVSIKGIKDSVKTRLANVAGLQTSLTTGDVILLDQYGEEVPFPDSGYEVTIAAPTSGKTTYAADTITAGTSDGTDTYTVTLKKGSDTLETFEFSVIVVDSKNITSFGIEDLNKFYTGSAAGNYDQQVAIYGLVDGNKVVVPQTWIAYVSASNGLIIDTAGAFTQPTSGNEYGSDDKDDASVITVLVDNGNTTVTVTKEVAFSSADPKAQSLVFKKDGEDIGDEVTSAKLSEYQSKISAVAKDQYGQELPAITSADTTKWIETNLTADSVQINVFIDGIYKSLKVIFEK